MQKAVRPRNTYPRSSASSNGIGTPNVRGAKRSFGDMRSQTEFGAESRLKEPSGNLCPAQISRVILAFSCDFGLQKRFVILAQAGIQNASPASINWVPACAGMTEKSSLWLRPEVAMGHSVSSVVVPVTGTRICYAGWCCFRSNSVILQNFLDLRDETWLNCRMYGL